MLIMMFISLTVEMNIGRCWLIFRGYALNLPSSFSANDPKRLSMFN
ncbi:MAG: hypothetical protein ACTS44_01240 [Candidatus Hodgkinia cicadicola]